METNTSKMDMETADLSPTEWLEEFIKISKEELELSKESSDDRLIVSYYGPVEYNNDSYYYDDDDDDDDNYINDDDADDGDDDDDNDDDNYINVDENRKKLKVLQYDSRMIRMASLFASQPRLEKICKDWDNSFFLTCFKTYIFISNDEDSVNEFHEKANDLEYLINLCGSNLTCLDVTNYPISQIMPIINANCPNLEELNSAFKEIMSQDFENVFCNMPHLRKLRIEYQCETSTLPMTLAKSLEQIGGTLKRLELSYDLQIIGTWKTLELSYERKNMFLPDSLASVFPRLIALKYLAICGFGLSQLLVQSIGEMKNLAFLSLFSYWPKKHPMLDTRINMYPIGNLKNLETLRILCDYGVRDEFLINLCNNAKKLRDLHIIGTNITDIGMSAIDNLQELEVFDIGLNGSDPRLRHNEFITDESIQCLFNQKLYSFNISNCIKITDKAVIKLVENLPNLNSLYIKNTKITREAVKKIYKLTEHRLKPLRVIENIDNVD